MKCGTKRILDNFVNMYKDLDCCFHAIYNAVELMIECYESDGKLLICGNGGSAADSEHIVAELMKGFLLPRTIDNSMKNALRDRFADDAEYLIGNLQNALPAISLVSHSALMTAFCNDKAADVVFAQQVLGYGRKGDILIAISTSGNSQNVLYAAKLAIIKGIKVVSLSGNTGGELKALSDVSINVPSHDTFIIQEYHQKIYHVICACIEQHFFKEDKSDCLFEERMFG